MWFSSGSNYVMSNGGGVASSTTHLLDFLEEPGARQRALSIASILTNTMEGKGGLSGQELVSRILNNYSQKAK
jgi:hypothetical protein